MNNSTQLDREESSSGALTFGFQELGPLASPQVAQLISGDTHVQAHQILTAEETLI